jgi:hypothetical protein
MTTELPVVEASLDFRGDLFVADTGNNRVRRFNQPIHDTTTSRHCTHAHKP